VSATTPRPSRRATSRTPSRRASPPWVWEDPARAARLAQRYNELFRSVVVPSHDGAHLSLPGLSASFRPHPTSATRWRILTEGRALLAHPLGAGKTATMVMAAMELRRLGMAAKPAVVLPNLLLRWTEHVLVGSL
jgi:N12 class adenine-specific DNA methylase